jgi:DNA-binding transcriptional LysR family regulator
MELSDLKIFCAVIQEGGINRAALRLHRVQSNVTTRIQQLESELGVSLFLREKRRLQLSPAGKVLLDYAQRLLDLAQEAREALHDAAPRGLLRLGSMESTAAARLPAPLAEFHRRYPEVTLELRTGASGDLVGRVLAGDLEAALVAEPVADPRLAKASLYEEVLVLVAEAGHGPITTPGDIPRRTLLTFGSGCVYRRRLESWLAADGLLPDRVVELASYHAILGCVVAGMGVALLPRSVLDTFPQQAHLSVHVFPATLQHMQTSLVWRSAASGGKIMALLEVLQAAA